MPRTTSLRTSLGGQPSIITAEFDRDAAFNNAQPRPWHGEVAIVTRKVWRQIFGLNPFKTSYFSLFRSIRGYRDRATLCAAVILAVAAGLPLPIIGIIFGKIINSFPPPEHELVIRLGELIGVGAAYFVVTAGYSIAWGLTGERISRHLRQALVERLLGLDQAYFDINDPDVSNLLTEKIESIQIGTSEKVGIFIQSISYFVAAFVVGFILNAKLTGILFAAVIPVMTIILIAGSSAISSYSKRASEYAEEASKLAESAISAVKVVQAFGMANTIGEEHRRLLRLSASYALRKSTGAALMLGAVYFTAYAANGLAFYVGSRIAQESGGSEAGTVYAVVFLILDASFVVGQFGPFLGAFATAAAAGEMIMDVLDEESPEVDVYAKEGLTADDQTLRQDIHFRNAAFVYPSRKTTVAMDNLSLTIYGGKMNAIVGMSGSGKSTLVSLLLRLYDVSSGHLLVGSQELKAFNVSSLRQRIALVDQDSVLFTGTILENIGHGLLSEVLSQEEILARCVQAAKDANCSFLDQLPDGINTKVGQGGYTQLSGGQKQRICLARALVTKPSLLLLDEPTSALDSRSESLVMDAVKRAATSGCTIVMVTHRLSTITDFDTISMMARGRVLEHGSHNELMAQNGAYRSLVRAQGIAKVSDSPLSESDGEDLSKKPSEKDLVLAKSSSKRGNQHSGHREARKNLGLWQVLTRTSRLNKEHWPLVALGLVLSIVSGGIILGESIVFGHLIQLLSSDLSDGDFQGRANLFCLLFVVLAIIALFSYGGSGTAFGIVSTQYIAKLQRISLATILRQDIQWFTGKSVSTLMTSLQSDAGQLSCLSGVALGTIFTVTTSVVGGIVLAHVVAWKIAIVLLAAVPVMVASGYVRLRVLALSETRHRSAYNDAASLAAEACRSMRTIAALGRERDVYETYKDALESPYRKGLRFTLISNVLLALSLSITYFVYALAYWWGAKQVREGHYTTLDFFIVLPALLFSAQSAGQVFSLSPEISRAGVAARNVFHLHDEQPTIMNDNLLDGKIQSDSISSLASSGSDEHGEKLQSLPKGQIELESVGLAYGSKASSPALDGISLKVQPGEFVALVGPSGAGKSSLVSLLERFYDPTSGRVLVDGGDIRELPVTAHRARIGLVPQDPDLFPGSISYNIQLGAAPGQIVSEAEVQEMCKKCRIHDFIVSLPEGYNTDCGTNGSKLSGGQKQRVAIARALVRNPEILLLDEYTSALDAHSEQEIKDALAGASEGRTTIVVAHRLATVQHADRIYLFDQGRIAETGTHSELAGQGGLYASMVKAQTLA